MWRPRSSTSSSAGPFRGFVLALLAGALIVPAGASAMTGGNLVVNGDGEAPVGSEWTAVAGGLTRLAHGTSSTPPLPNSEVLLDGPGNPPTPFPGGAYFLHPSGSEVITRNEQLITLTAADVAAVATGTVQARFSAYIGGWAAQNDNISATARWRDGSDAVVLSQPLAAVLAADRGSQSVFLFRNAQDPVPAAARSVTIELDGQRVDGSRHDGYIDNIDLRLIGIPQVEKAFASDVATVGRSFPITYTVRNSEDLEAKSPWSFSDTLPDGVRVASPSRATTTCPGARIVVSERRIAVAGAVTSGQDACRATVHVEATAAGRYVTGSEQLEEVVALRISDHVSSAITVAPAGDSGTPPAPPVGPGTGALPPIVVPPFVPNEPPAPPPVVPPVKPAFVRPALRATLQAPRRSQRVGDRLTLRLRASNPTETPASRVRACVTLPRGLQLTGAGERAARNRSSTRPCWSVGRLDARESWAVELRVRVTGDDDQRVRATVTSPAAVATASSRATVRVADGEGTSRTRRS